MLNTTSLNNYSETKYIIFRNKVPSFFLFGLLGFFYFVPFFFPGVGETTN